MPNDGSPNPEPFLSFFSLLSSSSSESPLLFPNPNPNPPSPLGPLRSTSPETASVFGTFTSDISMLGPLTSMSPLGKSIPVFPVVSTPGVSTLGPFRLMSPLGKLIP